MEIRRTRKTKKKRVWKVNKDVTLRNSACTHSASHQRDKVSSVAGGNGLSPSQEFPEVTGDREDDCWPRNSMFKSVLPPPCSCFNFVKSPKFDGAGSRWDGRRSQRLR